MSVIMKHSMPGQNCPLTIIKGIRLINDHFLTIRNCFPIKFSTFSLSHLSSSRRLHFDALFKVEQKALTQRKEKEF